MCKFTKYKRYHLLDLYYIGESYYRRFKVLKYDIVKYYILL